MTRWSNPISSSPTATYSIAASWTDLKTFHLVIEILSPSSIRADRFTKRRLYQEQRIPLYWIVDIDRRQVEVWTPEAHFPVIEREQLVWRHPALSTECRSSWRSCSPSAEQFDLASPSLRSGRPPWGRRSRKPPQPIPRRDRLPPRSCIIASISLLERFTVRHRVLSWIAVLSCAVVLPATAQRTTGVVGQYTALRSWPQEPRRFDLLHQRIEIRFDVPHRAIVGAVTTRVAITLAPTDTIRLNAENLTIDKATDARGKALKFTQDTTQVTVKLGRRAAVGDTVEFTLQYHGVPERGIYFVPRRNIIWSQGEATETRNWVPTYDAPNDKTTWEFLVTADTEHEGALQRPPGGGDAGERRRARTVWHWSQEKPASTYLYSVVAGAVHHPARPLARHTGGVLHLAGHRRLAAWRTFGETPQMIELYSAGAGRPIPVGQVRRVDHPRLHLRRHGERLRHDADRPRTARRRERAGARAAAG